MPAEEPFRKDSSSWRAFEFAQPETVTSEQASHSLSQTQLSVDASMDEAFTLNRPSKLKYVDQLKEELEHSKGELQERKSDIQRLKKDLQGAAEENGSLKEQFEKVKVHQQSWQKEEQNLHEEIAKLQANIEMISYAHVELKSEFNAATKIIKSLERENQDIESSIINSKKRLEMLVATSPSPNSIHFRAATEKLRDDIDTMQQAMATNIQNVNAYKTLLQSYETKLDELVLLRIDVRTMIGSYKIMRADISARNEALKVNLAKKETDIKALESTIANTVCQLSKQANEEFEYQRAEEYDSWQKLYEDRNKQFEKLHRNFRVFKEKAKKNYRPDLERENKALKSRLTASQDKNELLQDQILDLQGTSANWESEYKNLHFRYKQNSRESEQEIKRLSMEMKTYVQEYADKTPDKNPEWWNVRSLQSRNRDLERQLKDYMEALDDQKGKLRICYREYKTLQEENTAFRQELGVDDDIYRPNSNPQSRAAQLRRPNYESKEETAKRENILKGFKEKQAKARDKREEEQRVIEEARKYKMGEWYPPNHPKTYKVVQKKTVKERWEVDKFERLKAQGLI